MKLKKVILKRIEALDYDFKFHYAKDGSLLSKDNVMMISRKENQTFKKLFDLMIEIQTIELNSFKDLLDIHCEENFCFPNSDNFLSTKHVECLKAILSNVKRGIVFYSKRAFPILIKSGEFFIVIAPVIFEDEEEKRKREEEFKKRKKKYEKSLAMTI